MQTLDIDSLADISGAMKALVAEKRDSIMTVDAYKSASRGRGRGKEW
jgi:hypothetical protein